MRRKRPAVKVYAILVCVGSLSPLLASSPKGRGIRQYKRISPLDAWSRERCLTPWRTRPPFGRGWGGSETAGACGSFLVFCLAAVSFTPTAFAQSPLPDLNRVATGQILHPDGRQINLGGTMPQRIVMVPGKDLAIVICSGAMQSIDVIDTRDGRLLSSLPMQMVQDGETVPTGSAFYGAAIAPDGRTVYVSEGSRDSIGIYSLANSGTLTRAGSLDDSDPVRPARGIIPSVATHRFPAGLALNGPGTRLYVADNEGDTLTVFDTKRRVRLGRIPVGGYPLAVTAKPDGSRVYVTSERDGIVSIVDPQHMRKVADIVTGSHPVAFAFTRDYQTLYVANAESNTVSAIDVKRDRLLKKAYVRIASPAEHDSSKDPHGSAPSDIFQAQDNTLYLCLAGSNQVAVVSTQGNSPRLLGYIHAGWYPTAIALTRDGRQLLIANGKGSTARRPNGTGSEPSGPTAANSTLGTLRGSLSIIEINDKPQRAAQTGAPTASVPVRIPPQIKHVLYIIKENRTYDQVLGDVAEGDGDPSLVFFGKDVTPNQHALVHQFILLDNFFDCAEVSASGWNWSTSGYANEYVERTVPELYSERPGSKRPNARDYDYEGMNRGKIPLNEDEEDVAESPGGYLWDAAARAGITYRNYGCFLTPAVAIPTKKALRGTTSPNYAAFDLKYADSDAWKQLNLSSPGETSFGPSAVPSRYSGWKLEFDAFVKTGNLPALSIMRLPRDHTAATKPGMDAPRAMAADNDYAVGEIVDAVSHSPYWKDTAIFIVEDDPQSGADHVDSHRSTCYVISPWVYHNAVDHHFYNTDSVLRTIELILHMKPMTSQDALANALNCWAATPDMTPFTAIMPDRAILSEKNTRLSYGAARSSKLDFVHPDAAPDAEVNAILWGALKRTEGTP